MTIKLWNGYPIFDDSTTEGEVFDLRDPDGSSYARGLVPRDYTEHPIEMFDPPSQIPLIPKSEWSARIKEQEATKSSLEHVYLGASGGNPEFVNLDQNGNGYCWAYSTGHCIMLTRLIAHQPPVRLNPHSVAAIIKRGADQGGWCGLSAEFLKANGIAPEGTGPGQWPLHSRDVKKDTPELRTEMAKYKSTEDWVDLTRAVHARSLTFDQTISCLLGGLPCALDFNWWGHSVMGIRAIEPEPGAFGILILNSWKGWGRHGLGALAGSKTIPNGGVCIRTSRMTTVTA